MEKAPQTPALSLQKVTKTYGKGRGISGVSFSVNCGEIFGFLGPNGAGKSTTIRTIMNFQQPSSGEIQVLGLDSVRDSEKIKRRVGYLAGELALYEDLTGRQMLEFLGSFYENFDRSEVERLAERFDAELDRKLKELSKGNRQKIGLIQAFMHQPDLIILDEPTSGLDPLMQEEFFNVLEEARERQAAIFFSSHNITEIQRVADRAGVIRDGKLVAIEDVRKLRNMAVHRLQVQFGDTPPSVDDLRVVKNVDEVKLRGAVGSFVVSGSVDALIKTLARYEVLSIDREEASLEDIFLRYYESPDNKEDQA